MNLDEMRNNADLEHERDSLAKELSQKIEKKIEPVVENMFADFQAFFTNKGFEVTFGHNQALASYKNLKIELSHEGFSKRYLGCIFVVELKAASEMHTIRMHIVKSPVKQGIRPTTNPINFEIANLKSEIESFDENGFIFFLKETQSSYTSMTEILNDLFK